MDSISVYHILVRDKWKANFKPLYSFLNREANDYEAYGFQNGLKEIPKELRPACEQSSTLAVCWIQKNKTRIKEAESLLEPSEAYSYYLACSKIGIADEVSHLKKVIASSEHAATLYCENLGPLPEFEEKLKKEESVRLFWYSSEISKKLLDEKTEKAILNKIQPVWNKIGLYSELLRNYLSFRCQEKGRWIDFEKIILQKYEEEEPYKHETIFPIEYMLRDYLSYLPSEEKNRIRSLGTYFKNHETLSFEEGIIFRQYLRTFPSTMKLFQNLLEKYGEKDEE